MLNNFKQLIDNNHKNITLLDWQTFLILNGYIQLQTQFMIKYVLI